MAKKDKNKNIELDAQRKTEFTNQIRIHLNSSELQNTLFRYAATGNVKDFDEAINKALKKELERDRSKGYGYVDFIKTKKFELNTSFFTTQKRPDQYLMTITLSNGEGKVSISLNKDELSIIEDLRAQFDNIRVNKENTVEEQPEVVQLEPVQEVVKEQPAPREVVLNEYENNIILPKGCYSLGSFEEGFATPCPSKKHFWEQMDYFNLINEVAKSQGTFDDYVTTFEKTSHAIGSIIKQLENNNDDKAFNSEKFINRNTGISAKDYYGNILNTLKELQTERERINTEKAVEEAAKAEEEAKKVAEAEAARIAAEEEAKQAKLENTEEINIPVENAVETPVEEATEEAAEETVGEVPSEETIKDEEISEVESIPEITNSSLFTIEPNNIDGKSSKNFIISDASTGEILATVEDIEMLKRFSKTLGIYSKELKEVLADETETKTVENIENKFIHTNEISKTLKEKNFKENLPFIGYEDKTYTVSQLKNKAESLLTKFIPIAYKQVVNSYALTTASLEKNENEIASTTENQKPQETHTIYTTDQILSKKFLPSKKVLSEQFKYFEGEVKDILQDKKLSDNLKRRELNKILNAMALIAERLPEQKYTEIYLDDKTTANDIYIMASDAIEILSTSKTEDVKKDFLKHWENKPMMLKNSAGQLSFEGIKYIIENPLKDSNIKNPIEMTKAVTKYANEHLAELDEFVVKPVTKETEKEENTTVEVAEQQSKEEQKKVDDIMKENPVKSIENSKKEFLDNWKERCANGETFDYKDLHLNFEQLSAVVEKCDNWPLSKNKQYKAIRSELDKSLKKDLTEEEKIQESKEKFLAHWKEKYDEGNPFIYNKKDPINNKEITFEELTDIVSNSENWSFNTAEQNRIVNQEIRNQTEKREFDVPIITEEQFRNIKPSNDFINSEAEKKKLTLANLVTAANIVKDTADTAKNNNELRALVNKKFEKLGFTWSPQEIDKYCNSLKLNSAFTPKEKSLLEDVEKLAKFVKEKEFYTVNTKDTQIKHDQSTLTSDLKSFEDDYKKYQRKIEINNVFERAGRIASGDEMGVNLITDNSITGKAFRLFIAITFIAGKMLTMSALDSYEKLKKADKQKEPKKYVKKLFSKFLHKIKAITNLLNESIEKASIAFDKENDIQYEENKKEKSPKLSKEKVTEEIKEKMEPVKKKASEVSKWVQEHFKSEKKDKPVVDKQNSSATFDPELEKYKQSTAELDAKISKIQEMLKEHNISPKDFENTANKPILKSKDFQIR